MTSRLVTELSHVHEAHCRQLDGVIDADQQHWCTFRLRLWNDSIWTARKLNQRHLVACCSLFRQCQYVESATSCVRIFSRRRTVRCTRCVHCQRDVDVAGRRIRKTTSYRMSSSSTFFDHEYNAMIINILFSPLGCVLGLRCDERVQHDIALLFHRLSLAVVLSKDLLRQARYDALPTGSDAGHVTWSSWHFAQAWSWHKLMKLTVTVRPRKRDIIAWCRSWYIAFDISRSNCSVISLF